ncbi:hypothetical protein TKK_0009858 [Trichogramma kaykai]
MVNMSRNNSKSTLPGDDTVAPACFRAYKSRLTERFNAVESRTNSLDARFGAHETRCEEISRQQAEQGSQMAENSREIKELNQRISSEVADMREHLTDSANEISAFRDSPCPLFPLLNAHPNPFLAATDLINSLFLESVTFNNHSISQFKSLVFQKLHDRYVADSTALP